MGLEGGCFVRNKQNVGTVKNIYNGLHHATGKYIKLIGARDLLYNKNTLKDVFVFMEKNNVNVVLGRVFHGIMVK